MFASDFCHFYAVVGVCWTFQDHPNDATVFKWGRLSGADPHGPNIQKTSGCFGKKLLPFVTSVRSLLQDEWEKQGSLNGGGWKLAG